MKYLKFVKIVKVGNQEKWLFGHKCGSIQVLGAPNLVRRCWHTQSLPKTVVANDALAQSQFIDKPEPPIYGEGYATNGFRQEHTRPEGCGSIRIFDRIDRGVARAAKIKPQNCQILVIGAGVVATSIRSKNLRMRSICVLHKAVKGERRPILMPEASEKLRFGV